MPCVKKYREIMGKIAFTRSPLTYIPEIRIGAILIEVNCILSLAYKTILIFTSLNIYLYLVVY